MYTEDKELAEQCGKLVQGTKDAAAWLTANSQTVGRDLEAHLAELRQAERLFRRCHVAAQRKMCAGVFGPSQAGKSYLISAMARNGDGDLWAMFGDEAHDFIKEINPAGGRESTGLVTRFTLGKPESLPPGFPVHIRLLSETDLVKIFANTYYADAEHKAIPDRDALLAALNKLEQKKQGAPTSSKINQNEMEDLQEYLKKGFFAKPRVQLLEQLYWERATPLAPYLAPHDRAELFGLIWDSLPQFNSLLKTLSDGLHALDDATEAFCPLCSLLPREQSIIDVATLDNLLNGQSDSFDVIANNGRKTTLQRAVVTALTAELSISMRDQPADYFKHTDLLDFPGYRSRLKTEDIAKEATKDEMLIGFFLRGKVAYLFERFCAEKELTSLLLCIGGGPQEVQDLPSVINDWVISTHGETPESRNGKKVSLLFILTKADTEFDEKAGTPDVSTRWEDRLDSSLLNFFGKQHEWPRKWDSQGPFNKMFLLRNPNFKFDKVLDYDANGNEVSIRNGKEEYVQKLEAAFINSPAAKAHFADQKEAWDALMRFNDGGISYIRDSLGPLCDPSLKREQIKTTLNERLARLTRRLLPYWKTDDKEEDRKQKAALGMSIGRVLFSMAQAQRFGQFLRLLMLRDQDLYDLYFQAQYQIAEELAAETQAAPTTDSSLGNRVSADDMFADLFGDVPPPEAQDNAEESAAPAARQPKDEAQAFCERIEQFWLKQLHQIAENPILQQYFAFPARELSQFVHELGVGMVRCGVREAIEEALRKASRYANMEKERIIWKQVSLSAGLINAYVDWLGFDPRSASEARRTVSVGGRQRTLFIPPAPLNGLPVLGEDPSTYDRNFYTDWTAALVTLISENVDFDGEQSFDPEQNAKLKEVLDTFTIA